MTSDSTLARLRGANPIPRPDTVDAGDLFARITALPADPRLRRRPTPNRRRVLVLALALAVMALLASTAFAISNWVLGDAVGPQVTKAEYRNAQSQLALPPGYSWPALHVPPDSVTGRGAGGGHAVVAAENAWECYWVKAIRDGDASAQRRAQAELTALLDDNVIVAPAGASENWTPPKPPKTPYAVFADDGGLQWLRETYALAAAGHPQRLVARCRANHRAEPPPAAAAEQAGVPRSRFQGRERWVRRWCRCDVGIAESSPYDPGRYDNGSIRSPSSSIGLILPCSPTGAGTT